MPDGLGHELLAIGVFLFSHSLTNRPSVRDRAAQMLGTPRRFTVAYSLLSLVLLGWVILAYRQAPVILLWGQEPWSRWLPPLLMLPVCWLGMGGLLTPNPFSIGPGAVGYDPDHPGLLRLTRHPILWALALWALAHIPPNGDVAALLVFVPLAVLAVLGPYLLDRRRRRLWGEANWQYRARLTGRPAWCMLREMGWRIWALGLALYVVLLALHPWLIGAWPLP